MTESYEIYVSPAGIRVCSDGWDRYFQWTDTPLELEHCYGHNTGPEAVTRYKMREEADDGGGSV